MTGFPVVASCLDILAASIAELQILRQEDLDAHIKADDPEVEIECESSWEQHMDLP